MRGVGKRSVGADDTSYGAALLVFIMLVFYFFSFLILDSKVGSVVPKVCFGLFGVFFS